MNRRTDGRVLSDRYELGDRLGAGGMAEVYLGKDRVLGRTVAVKTLLHQYAEDQHFIERFRREAQSAAALNHPNVVSVYDTGSDDGTHYIVMEYVEGKTLRDVIREEGPLLPERVAEIGADVCAGLSFAHQHGIVHRDVKPANIMINTGGAVKVTDFGIARAVSGETVTQTAMVLGTAQYFSPEQAQSAPVDARSDIYALGVVLYEMLTRQVPFTGSSPVAIAYKHVKEAPSLPTHLNPDVPPEMEAIVMKALAKNPGNRYQSAEEMRQDLLRALHGRPVEATPVLSDATGMLSPLSDETVVLDRRGGAPVRAERTPEQRRRRTGLILLAAIVLAILAVAIWAIAGLIGAKKTVTVPEVLGLPIDQAEDRLKERGFEVDILPGVFSDRFDSGLVAVQDPEAGTRIEEGSLIKLTPSRGKEFVEVPNVVGKGKTDAERLLKKAGLEIGDVQRSPDPTRRSGTVIDQDPTAKTNVVKGTKVDLTVSSGPSMATVPDVVGALEDDAVRRIENEQLTAQVIHEPQSGDCAEEVGRVCRQDPAPGERVAEGSTVTIYVAEEPPEESPSPTPTPTPTPTASETPS